MDHSLDAIALGFNAHTEEERYSHVACNSDPATTRLAIILEKGKPHVKQIPEWVKRRMQDRVMQLYDAIPAEIIITEHEPYITAEQMREDIEQRGVFRVRFRSVGPVVGKRTQEWRAVHDYYGHVLTGGSFTFSGELLAYSKHTDQFPRECWPFIWNNVVLENAYRLNRGHFYCHIKQCPSVIVYDEEKFGPMVAFYQGVK